MDIGAQKAEVLKQLEKALEASIDRGLKESQRGKVISHVQVMKEIRDRYKAYQDPCELKI